MAFKIATNKFFYEFFFFQEKTAYGIASFLVGSEMFIKDRVGQVILKELKTVKEQIDSCPAERTDLLAEYQQRYDIMSEYAPAMLSEEEVRKILTEKFADVIATKNKGQIMKTVMPELKGKADGKLIGQVVAELCK